MNDPNEIPAALTKSPGFLLNQAARSIRNLTAIALKPVGLAPQEYGLLRLLSLEGPMSQQSLANKYQIDRATVTEIIDVLERRGLLQREPMATDRRCKEIHLTPTGSRVITRASKSVSRAHHKFLAPLTDEEWTVVQECLMRLITAARAGIPEE